MAQGISMARPKESIAIRIEKGKLDKDWQKNILALAKEGASDVELRLELNISDDLWYRWIDEEPEFSRTIKKARMLCQVWWEQQGRKMVTGEVQGNVTSWIFNMKNRFGWTDRVQQDNISTDGSIQLSWED